VLAGWDWGLWNIKFKVLWWFMGPARRVFGHLLLFHFCWIDEPFALMAAFCVGMGCQWVQSSALVSSGCVRSGLLV
jgi:hypothetical protein